ncbi:hypothetical protein BC831DRAFT_110753 [Entophlyctis helioformis]|nr:hypothetical protein BC831DRAFT_110753 [Entophlyctis helioformis]
METMAAAAAEAVQSHQRAQYNPSSKDKDVQKLNIKAAVAQEKAAHVKDMFTACEQIVRAAEEEYYGRSLPGLYQEVQRDEEGRCIAVKNVLEKCNILEMKMVESYVGSLRDASKSISSFDIPKDIADFVANHMTEHGEMDPDDDFSSVPPGSIKWGMLQVRRDDGPSQWKARTLILREEKFTLSFYEPTDMSKPKDSVSMRSSAVHCVDTSFFGKPCFQVISTTADDRQVAFNCITDTEATRDDWINVLQRYTYCCDKCARLNGFNPETARNESLANDSSVKFSRSFWLKIIEAKDLRTPSSVRSTLAPYCAVVFDDVKFARSTIKSGETPMWGEAFSFNGLAPHFTRLRVAIFHSNRSGRDVNIGYASIDLKNLKSGFKADLWIPIQSVSEDGPCGAIRLAYVMTNEQILPTAAYTDFLEFVTEPSFAVVKTVGKLVAQEREEFAKTFLNLLFGLKRDTEGICMLVRDEVMATDDPNIIFRGNTLATKIVDQYMKSIGTEFLHATLSPLIRAVYENGDPCETDPSRIDPSQGASSPAVVDAVRKNTKRLLQFVGFFWEMIQRSIDTFPPRIMRVFAYIKEMVSTKFAGQQYRGEHVKYPAISGFIFLRFFCPAIISPHQFGLASEAPSGNVPRTLTLIAKILQNMANMTEIKDVHLAEANVFLRSQKESVKALLDKVSTMPADDAMDAVEGQSGLGEVDIARQCESMYQFLDRHNHTIAMNNRDGNPVIEQLMQILDDIKRRHSLHEPDMTRTIEQWASDENLAAGLAFDAMRGPYFHQKDSSAESIASNKTPRETVVAQQASAQSALRLMADNRQRTAGKDALSPSAISPPTMSPPQKTLAIQAQWQATMHEQGGTTSPTSPMDYGSMPSSMPGSGRPSGTDSPATAMSRNATIYRGVAQQPSQQQQQQQQQIVTPQRPTTPHALYTPQSQSQQQHPYMAHAPPPLDVRTPVATPIYPARVESAQLPDSARSADTQTLYSGIKDRLPMSPPRLGGNIESSASPFVAEMLDVIVTTTSSMPSNLAYVPPAGHAPGSGTLGSSVARPLFTDADGFMDGYADDNASGEESLIDSFGLPSKQSDDGSTSSTTTAAKRAGMMSPMALRFQMSSSGAGAPAANSPMTPSSKSGPFSNVGEYTSVASPYSVPSIPKRTHSAAPSSAAYHAAAAVTEKTPPMPTSNLVTSQYNGSFSQPSDTTTMAFLNTASNPASAIPIERPRTPGSAIPIDRPRTPGRIAYGGTGDTSAPSSAPTSAQLIPDARSNLQSTDSLYALYETYGAASRQQSSTNVQLMARSTSLAQGVDGTDPSQSGVPNPTVSQAAALLFPERGSSTRPMHGGQMKRLETDNASPMASPVTSPTTMPQPLNGSK